MTYTKKMLTNWTFKGSENDNWLNATVPGTVHTDLYHNNLIPHPFENKNELDLQWIDKKDWEYKTTLTLTKDMLNEEQIDLIFDGLDTFATVYVNDQPVIEADNMFRQWKANIKNFVHEGENDVRVYFHSPVTKGLDLLENSDYALPAPNDDSHLGGLEDKKISVFMRKTPYHFGWDWGPRFVTSGIWKEPRIECWSHTKIEDLYIEQNAINKQKADLTVHIKVQSSAKQNITLHLKTDGFETTESIDLEEGLTSYAIPVVIDQPKLWWTHDLGEQPLYEFSLSLIDEQKQHLHSSQRTGLRDVRLVQEDDEHGKSFYFELNGIPLFIKGSNHIPLDYFLPEIEEKSYINEINSAVDANMNLLRVWGGGIYEQDIFYETCDEKGMLVWQDFMFACSMYPGTENFLNNVSVELEENIVRLRNHPSIALWCGNNEIDSMWKEYSAHSARRWPERYEPDQRKEVWKAYDDLFHKLIPKKLDELLPNNDYWPSSPMAELTYDENQHASLKRHRGDIHFWNVWHSHAPIEIYSEWVGRFMSEYGFQSFPERSTYERLAPGHDLSIESDIVTHHQKNISGNEMIFSYLDKYHKEPKGFDGYVYLSQHLQAYAFDTGIRTHRKAMPYCMGTIYWQINDAWPGASWSSIDYYGNWKAAHYIIKKAYREMILAVEDTGKQVIIYAVSDYLKDKTVTLKLNQRSILTNEVFYSQEVSVNVPKQSSNVLYKIDKTELETNESLNQTYLDIELVEDSKSQLDTLLHFFDRFKNIELPTPSISYTSEVTKQGVEYTLQTDALAKGIYLQLPIEGKFDDNHFDLVPGKTYKVTFSPTDKKSFNQSTKINALNITSMVDYIM